MMNSRMSEVAQNDAELVGLSLRGDRDAFGRIVARYQSLICSLAYSSTGNLGQSEDLAQETFLTAWKQLPGLREPEKLKSWLCRIARNLSYDLLRKEGREPSHQAEALEDESPAGEPQPLDQTITNEEEAILWRSLEKIPELYREPLVLFYRQHQSVDAVAKSLELTGDAVKQRLSRGRKLLHEQVLAFVEGALERTNPGKVFTAGVIATLPALTFSAKAVTLGTAAAKGGTTAKAAVGMGVLSVIFGPLLIFFGNYVGYRMSLDNAHSNEERVRIRGIYKRILTMVAVFFVAFAGFIVWALRHEKNHSLLFVLLFVGLVVIYLATVFAFALTTLKERRRYLSSIANSKAGDASAQPAWEYRSAWSFLGMPLIHIRVGDRFSAIKKPVIAWIAAGDCAVGGLIAFGGMAIAPFSVGGFAIGLLPFGGMTIGVLAMGGFCLGIWSYGGLAVGWKAIGGFALAWKAAIGGVSLAHDYALGGVAQAAQANNDIAHLFADHDTFFRMVNTFQPYSVWLHLLWVVPMIIQWQLIARNRRRVQAQGKA